MGEQQEEQRVERVTRDSFGSLKRGVDGLIGVRPDFNREIIVWMAEPHPERTGQISYTQVSLNYDQALMLLDHLKRSISKAEQVHEVMRDHSSNE